MLDVISAIFRALGSVFLVIFGYIRSLLTTNDIIIPPPSILNKGGGDVTSGKFLSGIWSGINSESHIFNKTVTGDQVSTYYENGSTGPESSAVNFYYGLRNYMPIIEPVGQWPRRIMEWIAKLFYLLDVSLQQLYVDMFNIMDVTSGENGDTYNKGMEAPASNTGGISLAGWFHDGETIGTIIFVIVLLFYIISMMLAINTSGFQRIKDIMYDLLLAMFFLFTLPWMTGFATHGAYSIANAALGTNRSATEQQMEDSTMNTGSLANDIFYTNVYDVAYRIMGMNPGQEIPVSGKGIMQVNNYLYSAGENNSNSGSNANSGMSGRFHWLEGGATSEAGNNNGKSIEAPQYVVNLAAMPESDRDKWNGLYHTSIVNFLEDYGTDDDVLNQNTLENLETETQKDNQPNSDNNSVSDSGNDSNNDKGFKKSVNNSTKNKKNQNAPQHEGKEEKSKAEKTAEKNPNPDNVKLIILPKLLNTINPRICASDLVDTINPVSKYNSIVNPFGNVYITLINKMGGYINQWRHLRFGGKKAGHWDNEAQVQHDINLNKDRSKGLASNQSGDEAKEAANRVISKDEKELAKMKGKSSKAGKKASKESKKANNKSKKDNNNVINDMNNACKGNNSTKECQVQNSGNSSGHHMDVLFEYHLTGAGRYAEINELSGFKGHALHVMLNFSQYYGQYKVNWTDIMLGLLTLFVVLAGFTGKLVSAWFKAMVMYAVSWIMIGKSIDSPSKIKYYIRSYFSLWEMLIMDVVMIRIYFIGYITIQEVIPRIMLSPSFPVTGNSIIIGIVQAIFDIALLMAALSGVSAISRILGQPTGASDGWAKAALGLGLAGQAASGAFRLGKGALSLGAGGLMKGSKGAMGLANKAWGHHKNHAMKKGLSGKKSKLGNLLNRKHKNGSDKKSKDKNPLNNAATSKDSSKATKKKRNQAHLKKAHARNKKRNEAYKKKHNSKNNKPKSKQKGTKKSSKNKQKGSKNSKGPSHQKRSGGKGSHRATSTNAVKGGNNPLSSLSNNPPTNTADDSSSTDNTEDNQGDGQGGQTSSEMSNERADAESSQESNSTSSPSTSSDDDTGDDATDNVDSYNNDGSESNPTSQDSDNKVTGKNKPNTATKRGVTNANKSGTKNPNTTKYHPFGHMYHGALHALHAAGRVGFGIGNAGRIASNILNGTPFADNKPDISNDKHFGGNNNSQQPPSGPKTNKGASTVPIAMNKHGKPATKNHHLVNANTGQEITGTGVTPIATANGNPITDSNGNLISAVNGNSFGDGTSPLATDSDGNLETDSDGNYIDASTGEAIQGSGSTLAMTDSNGSLLSDGNGNAINAHTKAPIRTGKNARQNRQNDSNPLARHADGTLKTDNNGNYRNKKTGQAYSNSGHTGVVTRGGIPVRNDANSMMRADNGKPLSGRGSSLQTRNGKPVKDANGNFMTSNNQPIAHSGTTNIATSDGNPITGSNNQAINSDTGNEVPSSSTPIATVNNVPLQASDGSYISAITGQSVTGTGTSPIASSNGQAITDDNGNYMSTTSNTPLAGSSSVGVATASDGSIMTDNSGNAQVADTGQSVDTIPVSQPADLNQIHSSMPTSAQRQYVGSGQTVGQTYFPTASEAYQSTGGNEQKANQYFSYGATANPNYQPMTRIQPQQPNFINNTQTQRPHQMRYQSTFGQPQSQQTQQDSFFNRPVFVPNRSGQNKLYEQSVQAIQNEQAHDNQASNNIMNNFANHNRNPVHNSHPDFRNNNGVDNNGPIHRKLF